MTAPASSNPAPARRGRGARRAAREASSGGPAWLPPLERNIPYVDLLSPAEVDRIHDESMKLLEEVGIVFRDDESAAMWKAAGADVDGHLVKVDRHHLMELISTAPETYTMQARNPERSVKVGGTSTIFTPSYGAPFVLDFDGSRRNATQEDFDNFAKLAYLEPALHMTGGVLCEPMDVSVSHRHLTMTESLLKHSDKTFMGAVTSRQRAEDSLHMAGIVFGQDVVRETTVMTCLANCNSPLLWDATMLDAVKVYAGANQAMLFSPFVLGGASTPASTIGSVIQLSAEALAGVAFSQLVRPGAPAVYGQWLSTVNMQSGAPQAGTPEIDHMNLLVGQLARFYKLPWRCSGGQSSSKIVDAQAGYEAGRNMFGVLLAGANFVLSTTGYLDGALCQSYAKVALDGEQLRMHHRFGRGVSFDGIDGVLDAMREVPHGGHHLGTAHTLANFEEAFVMPELMTTDNFEQWEIDGSLDAEQRGARKAQQLLASYEAPKLPDDVAEELTEFVARRRQEIPEGLE